MENISGFGFQVNIIASNTFPTGFNVTEFADDADPFDIPSIQISDTAMGLNGDQITWSKANPIKITLSVIPGGVNDTALSILLEANRVSRGKSGAQDVITMTGIYPTGNFITLINGVITDGMPGNAVSSEGRLKSKSYVFSFESKVSA